MKTTGVKDIPKFGLLVFWDTLMATYLALLLPLAEAISRRLGFWWTNVVVLKAPSACQTVPNLFSMAAFANLIVQCVIHTDVH